MNTMADILTNDTYEFPLLERPVSAPIYQTSLFTFPSVQDLRKALEDELSTHLYSRGNNPTVELVQQRIAALEGGERAKLFSSGVAAIASSILSCVKEGDHIICCNDAYTWAKYICTTYLKRFGVSVTFVDASNLSEVEQAIKSNTKVLYLESPGTLYMKVHDLGMLASLAKAHKITSIVDNTWATPLYQNPLSMGIDLVVHSASKYLGGHSDIIGGAVVGSKSMVEYITRSEFLPIGHVPDPFQAWLIQRGMRTLHVRLAYHYQSALKVCDYLYAHPSIEEVFYPMHPKSPEYALASKQMRGGSGLLAFKVKSRDREKIESMVNTLTKFRIGVSWGGYESLVFPVVATKDGDASTLRLHIGLEDTQSLLDDLDHALSFL